MEAPRECLRYCLMATITISCVPGCVHVDCNVSTQPSFSQHVGVVVSFRKKTGNSFSKFCPFFRVYTIGNVNVFNEESGYLNIDLARWFDKAVAR